MPHLPLSLRLLLSTAQQKKTTEKVEEKVESEALPVPTPPVAAAEAAAFNPFSEKPTESQKVEEKKWTAWGIFSTAGKPTEKVEEKVEPAAVPVPTPPVAAAEAPQEELPPPPASAIDANDAAAIKKARDDALVRKRAIEERMAADAAALEEEEQRLNDIRRKLMEQDKVRQRSESLRSSIEEDKREIRRLEIENERRKEVTRQAEEAVRQAAAAQVACEAQLNSQREHCQQLEQEMVDFLLQIRKDAEEEHAGQVDDSSANAPLKEDAGQAVDSSADDPRVAAETATTAGLLKQLLRTAEAPPPPPPPGD